MRPIFSSSRLPYDRGIIIGKHAISAAVDQAQTGAKRAVYQSRPIKLAECPVITCERAISRHKTVKRL